MRPSVVVSIVLVACSACISIPLRGGREQLGRKSVASKDPPQRLLAPDGTGCLVAPRRFQEVRIGERVWCHWTAYSATGLGGLRPNTRLKLTARID